ncbi:MAG: DNA-binding protein [Nostoc sp. DedQUE08]|uniref:DNA-binding protein n=1 Tax=unclassified Nostoc TaxID=2593658 RepID=UPI002AD1D25D|nr:MULTISPECIES: DNA-binding protein [unclassified Nostoc]MDZ8066981.1 DNA-binding protein [Nostoc sp. DedQUE08]MDZ8140114.1 DNA-binding protein [Nostoc sp. DedQUE04]
MQSIEEAYTLAWVKTACEHVLGKSISIRAWRKWLRICGVKQYARQVRLKECCYLLGLAYLKSQNLFKKYSLSDVSLLLKKDQERFAQFGIDLEEPDFPLSGRELPNFIYDRTKRKISLRTVYRWAEKHSIPFSVSRIIPPQELIRWLELGNAL